LNAIGSRLGAEERVVTIESNVELLLPDHHNLVALQSTGSQTIEDLINFAAAVQPDRSLIGSVSGGKSVRSVIEAMDGPLEGAVFAYAASSPEEAVNRLLNSELTSTGLSSHEAGKMLSTAITVLYQEQRFADGSRRITRISELSVTAGDASIEDIFVFEGEGLDEDGLVAGTFRATGYVPRFLEELHARGDDVDLGIFDG
jgi:Flp pilus assembly CpaF family ATPase